MTDDEIFEAVQKDVRAAVQAGLKIDLDTFGVMRVDDVWAPFDQRDCGVCLIGAYVLGKPAKNGETNTFIESVGRNFDWGSGFLHGSFQEPDSLPERRVNDEDYMAGYNLARRLGAWAIQEGFIK